MARINGSDIIIEIAESVKFLGFEETIFLLQEARKDKIYKKRINDILSIICELIEIDVDKVNHPNLRDDKRKVAIGMCIYFSKKYYNYTYEEISRALKLNLKFQILNRYHKLVKNAKFSYPNSNVDELISKKISQIDSEIQKKTTKLN